MDVLVRQHAGSKGLGSVVLKHRDLYLRYYWPAIVLLIDEVNGNARYGFARLQNGGVNSVAEHALPSELGQKRRMHVQHSVPIFSKSAGAKLLHVPGQHDQFDSMTLQRPLDGRVESMWPRMGDAAEVRRRDTRDTRSFQYESAGVVGDDNSNLSVERSGTAGVQYRLEIGAGVRGKHTQPELPHERRSLVRDNLLGLHHQLVHF